MRAKAGAERLAELPAGDAGEPGSLLETGDASLLELVDHLLNQGVVLTGEVVLGLAGVDLVYLRLSALLCAADRLLPRPGSG